MKLVLVLAWAFLEISSPEAARGNPESRLRVLVVRTEEAPAGERPSPGKTSGSPPRGVLRDPSFEIRIGSSLSEADLEWAEVVFLERGASTLREKQIAALAESVRQGKVLLVGSKAARALPASAVYSDLLGREKLGKRSTVPTSLAVAMLDQKHPVTQCVTHFLHRGTDQPFDLAREAEILARCLPASGEAVAESGEKLRARPALWVVRRRHGTVIVTSLDHTEGPSRDLVSILLGRAAQWAARGRVTLPLTGEFRLAATRLGPEDAGLIPGRPPGKGFYRGRQIAPVMGFGGASWLLRGERERTEMPGKLLDSLKIRPGQQVVDLGAGVGFFSLRLARRVGEKGKVYAVDIQQEMLDRLKQRATSAGVENIDAVLGTVKDPRLPEASADLVLMVDVYHELSEPRSVIEKVRRALRKDGRLVLVEYRGEDPSVPIKPLHRMTVRQARAELESVGFELREVKDFLPHQHILIFGISRR